MIKILLLIFIVSCSSKPKLYPNQHFKNQDEKKISQDIDDCISESEKYLKSGKGKQIAKSAGWGAAVGGAIGAVGGLFTGDVGGGLVRGSATGGAGGAASGAVSPDQLKRQYVNRCLSNKGYEVIGWD